MMLTIFFETVLKNEWSRLSIHIRFTKLWKRIDKYMDEISNYWAPKSLQMVTAAMKLKDTCSLEEKLWQT